MKLRANVKISLKDATEFYKNRWFEFNIIKIGSRDVIRLQDKFKTEFLVADTEGYVDIATISDWFPRPAWLFEGYGDQ